MIEHDGTVAPLSYGFPRRFAFGNLREERLATMTKRWIESQAGAFCEVYRRRAAPGAHRRPHVRGSVPDAVRWKRRRGESGHTGRGLRNAGQAPEEARNGPSKKKGPVSRPPLRTA